LLRTGEGEKDFVCLLDSANWKEYIETAILPRIETHAIILNWSKRREWGSGQELETGCSTTGPGQENFVPVAICFSSLCKARVYRLWQHDEHSKHGKVRMSKEAEGAFLETVKRFSS
jgi:hypothetical protein